MALLLLMRRPRPPDHIHRPPVADRHSSRARRTSLLPADDMSFAIRLPTVYSPSRRATVYTDTLPNALFLFMSAFFFDVIQRPRHVTTPSRITPRHAIPTCCRHTSAIYYLTPMSVYAPLFESAHVTLISRLSPAQRSRCVVLRCRAAKCARDTSFF